MAIAIPKLFFYYFVILTANLTVAIGSYKFYNDNDKNKVDVKGPMKQRFLTPTQTKTNENMDFQSTSVDSPHNDKFYNLEVNWRALLVSKEVDATNADIREYVGSLSGGAKSLYRSLQKKSLWPIQEEEFSAQLTTQCRRLQKITLAFGTKGTTFYKHPEILSTVKDGLDFLTESERYNGVDYIGNWWDWQVGIPICFIDILMIVKDELSSEKIHKYTNIIRKYVPDLHSRLYTEWNTKTELTTSAFYYVSGTIQAEYAKTILGLGILQKNEEKILSSVHSIEEGLNLVTKGNGFYQDGSFIQHDNVPYIGEYGNDLLNTWGTILSVTKGSEFEISPNVAITLVETVERAFLPFIYRGEPIAPVKGRAISRPGHESNVMYNLLKMPYSSEKIKESVKYWMLQNPKYFLSNAKTYSELLLTIALLKDPTIIGNKLPFFGSKMYASMDRFVQRTNDYMMALSLYSYRISAFVAGNKENKRGWHTADGAVYLYNNDDVQFNFTYWPTVDPYRIPGTTVDTRHVEDEVSSFPKFFSKQHWVGGVANANQAVVGMALNKKEFKNNGRDLHMNLKAMKSWFVVDGKIVALGAGITGATTASIETIVDNRLLNENYNYNVLSNRKEINAEKETVCVSENGWLLLETDLPNASIGYYFPCGETIDVISETRSGNYASINEAFPSYDIYTGKYRKFIINHGNTTNNAKYAYVILPATDRSKLRDYANSSNVNIIKNTADIQAVELKYEGYLGINVWVDREKVEIAGITVYNSMSLLRQINGRRHTYVLSDPKQLSDNITLQIPNFSRVETINDGIYYDLKNNWFVVNVANARGASKQFTVYV